MSDFKVNLFYSYSHVDEAYRNEMEKHLSLLKDQGHLQDFHDRKIQPGSNINNTIEKEIDKADIVVFLISVDFLNSDACKKEWRYANNAAKKSQKRLISIIVRECGWLDFEDMGDFLALPKDGLAIADWSSQDKAWNDVYKGIKITIENLKKNFTIKNEFKSELEKIEFCSLGDKNINLSEIFVFPNLAMLLEEKETEIDIKDLDEFTNLSKVIVKGEELSGKTKLCSFIVLELNKVGKSVLYVNLNDIAHKQAKIEHIKNVYSKQFHGDFDEWIKSEETYIIFDNMSHLNNSLDFILLAEEYFHKILVCTSNDEFDSYYIDEQRLVGFELLSLKPFTHIKQEQLIRNWLLLKVSDNKVSDAEIDKIENNINSIIINNRILPRYPFFILSILQTHEAFMPKDIEITAYGHCYYALIIAHLIKSGIEPKDESISACLNYASHLAFEIFSKNPDSLTLEESELNDFDNKYQEDYIIAKSVLNRMKSENGIIKKVNGAGYCFSLPYSYYYFLGSYLSKDYRNQMEVIGNLVENSYRKNNSITLIFTVHHSQSVEIIDEILAHTACAIDNLEPAKLDDRETKVFNDILDAMPQKLTSKGVDAERQNERKLRDESEVASESSVVDEYASHDAMLEEVFRCHKNMEILSQILKNKVGSLNRRKIKEIVEIICDAGLRLANIIMTDPKIMDELINYVQRSFAESDSYSLDVPRERQLEILRKAVIFRSFLWVISNIERCVSAINKPEISSVVQELTREKGTLAYEIINYFYSLDTATGFNVENRDHLRELITENDLKKNPFIFRIFSIRTQHYMNTHTVKEPIQQSVNSILGLEYKATLKKVPKKGKSSKLRGRP